MGHHKKESMSAILNLRAYSVLALGCLQTFQKDIVVETTYQNSSLNAVKKSWQASENCGSASSQVELYAEHVVCLISVQSEFIQLRAYAKNELRKEPRQSR